MSNDFELKTLNDKILSLAKEKDQLAHDIITAERNEQMELDKVRRDFSILVSNIKSRQSNVERELSNQKRNLESLERRRQIEQNKKDFEETEKRNHEEMRRRLK